MGDFLRLIFILLQSSQACFQGCGLLKQPKYVMVHIMKAAIICLTLLGIATSALAVDKVTLDNRIRRLRMKFDEMQQKPDRSIPAETLRKAQGIVLLDRTKLGFIFGFQGGSGVALVKDPKSEQWGPAAFLGATEASLGFQVGGQQSFIVILLMSTNATRMLTKHTFEFGGEARGTAGNASAGVDATVTSQEQAMLVFEDRKGLYGGVDLKGGLLSADAAANLAYYEEALTLQDVLFDQKVKPTDATSELVQKITGSGSSGMASIATVPVAQITQKLIDSNSATATKFASTNPSIITTPAPTSLAQPELANEQLRLLLADLKINKQTNALNHLNGYLTAMLTSVYTADAEMTLLILERLRGSQTPDGITLLETRLDGALINLGTSVGATPQKERPADSLKTLRRARDYRGRFPRTSGDPNIDNGLAQAWSLVQNQK